MVTSSSDLFLGSKVKGKVQMFGFDQRSKVSNGDLVIQPVLGVKGQKKGKGLILSNFEGKDVKMFVLDQRSRASMVTLSFDPSFGGSKVKKVNIQLCPISKRCSNCSIGHPTFSRRSKVKRGKILALFNFKG